MLTAINTKKLTTSCIVAILLIFNFILLQLTPIAQAQTTTTKYLNGKILFDGDRDGGGIFTMNPDGSQITNIDPLGGWGASWSADSAKIAFVTERDGNNTEVYTMNADGSNPVRLTTNTAYEDYPTWSPDGTKIVFESNRDSTYSLWKMDANGSNQAKLTNNGSCSEWSADGTKIAFLTSRDGNNEIYTMDADGSNAIRITNNPAEDDCPSWSPDGTKIVFFSNRDGNNEIYTMNADGTNQTRLTNNSVDDQIPNWSPDGTKIVYDSREAGASNIAVMNIDGSNQTMLTNGSFFNENYGSHSWQKLPYTVNINDDGSTTSTISSDKDYSSTDYTVQSNETLVLDGTLCDVTVQSGGTLMGTGSIAPDCTLTVESGGILTPGHSPGCLASGNVVLSGTYQAELAGTTACTQYDQLQVTGTVNLTGSTLTPSLLNGFVPTTGNSFTIINNDATDPVTGTFTNLPEGATVTVGSSLFKISYVGGTGNDVVLTAQAVPGSPNTGYQTFAKNPLLIFTVPILTAGILFALTKIKRTRKIGDRLV